MIWSPRSSRRLRGQRRAPYVIEHCKLMRAGAFSERLKDAKPAPSPHVGEGNELYSVLRYEDAVAFKISLSRSTWRSQPFWRQSPLRPAFCIELVRWSYIGFGIVGIPACGKASFVKAARINTGEKSVIAAIDHKESGARQRGYIGMRVTDKQGPIFVTELFRTCCATPLGNGYPSHRTPL